MNIFGERWKTDNLDLLVNWGNWCCNSCNVIFTWNLENLHKTENCIPDNLFSDTHESEVKRCPSVNGKSQCDVHVSPGVVASRAVERREVSIEEFKWESIVCLDVPSHVQVHVYICAKQQKRIKRKKYLENQQEKGLTCTTRWVRELYRRLSPP